MSQTTRARRAAAFAAATLAAAALGAGAAQATTVFSDNFNAENGGVAANPYTAFANWTMDYGAFHLVEGAHCQGGAGGCVGLDGPGPVANQFHTKASFSYQTGAVVTLTYSMSGSHFDCGHCDQDDYYEAGFRLTGFPLTLSNVTFDGSQFGDVSVPGNQLLFGNGFPVFRNDPWITHTISFTANKAGAVGITLLSNSLDGAGPLLDNVSLDITGGHGGAPEPAAWSLLIAGFGLAGGALRRGRSAVRAAA